MKTKQMSIANFNVVFGEEEKPLLDYFDSIVMPAFKSNYQNIVNETMFEFVNVKIIEVEKGINALTGILLKSTKLEVKSKLNENGDLIATDESYPTAPYSFFVIYLNNHRMSLVKNQKGSPTLMNFASTFKKMITAYTSKQKIMTTRKTGGFLYPYKGILPASA